MEQQKTFRLVLPKPISVPDHPGFIETVGPIVIVGANGAGKTRLGTWLDLESEQKKSPTG